MMISVDETKTYAVKQFKSKGQSNYITFCIPCSIDGDVAASYKDTQSVEETCKVVNLGCDARQRQVSIDMWSVS